MPTTKQYTVYKFSELPEKTRAEIVERNRHINVDNDFWYDYVIEDGKEALEEQGFIEPTIYFRGFSSQGDGACFDIKGFDAAKYIAFHKLGKKFPRIKKEPKAIYGYIRKNSLASHYSHYNTRDFEITVELSETEKEHTVPWWNKYEEEAMRFQEHVEETRIELSQNIYGKLEAAYSSQTDDDAIIETIQDNEYYFTEDGEIE